MRWLLVAIVGLAALLVAPAAAAQAGQQWNTLRMAGGHQVAVRAHWQPQVGGGTTRVSLATHKGQVQLPGGGFVRTAVAVSGQTVLVVLTEGGVRPRVRLALVELAADGTAGKPLIVAVKRQAAAGYRPAAAVACADPDGFTVLWQEQKLAAGGGRPDGRTYFTRISARGAWLEPPRQVSIPWALGAIVHNGSGYHLAIYFDGNGPGQTRLCGVTLSRAGQSQQHPWWATAAQTIDETQLIRVGGSVWAYFRGGADGMELRSVELTTPGSWGTVAGAATSHGRLKPTEEFALRPLSGAPEVIRTAL